MIPESRQPGDAPGAGNLPAIPAHLSKPGTYILVARLHSPRRLKIGKLGEFEFPTGWYAYVGSAFGRGGLAGRLGSHCHRRGCLHWHVDYLLEFARIESFRVATGLPRQTEHLWANWIMGLPDARTPAPGFGASDCPCRTHLFQFEHQPDFWSLEGRLPAPANRVSPLLLP